MYLDHWVWIRLARAAANGEPRRRPTFGFWTRVCDAAAGGVAFPLSTTHYIETSKITSRRQRLDLAWTIASSPIAVPCAHVRSCCAIKRCASSSSCCATRAAAYYGDILLPADLDRVAVPPGRDAPAALTSRHRVDAISTPVILPLVRHALADGTVTKF